MFKTTHGRRDLEIGIVREFTLLGRYKAVGSNYGEGMKDGVGAEGIGIVASVGHHVRASIYVLTFSSVTVQVDRRGDALPRSHQRVVQRMLRDPLVVCTRVEGRVKGGGEG